MTYGLTPHERPLLESENDLYPHQIEPGPLVPEDWLSFVFHLHQEDAVVGEPVTLTKYNNPTGYFDIVFITAIAYDLTTFPDQENLGVGNQNFEFQLFYGDEGNSLPSNNFDGVSTVNGLNGAGTGQRQYWLRTPLRVQANTYMNMDITVLQPMSVEIVLHGRKVAV
jgi:hypothetical protein